MLTFASTAAGDPWPAPLPVTRDSWPIMILQVPNLPGRADSGGRDQYPIMKQCELQKANFF